MALCWSPQHLAKHVTSLPQASVRSDTSLNARHKGSLLQHSAALSARKGSGKQNECQFSAVGVARVINGVPCRAGPEEQKPQAPCRFVSEGKVQKTNCDALHFAVSACSSSIPEEPSPPQGPRMFQTLTKVALLVLPVLFVLTISGSAIALEPQNTHTLNSIIVPPQGAHMSLGQRIAVALRSLGLPDWVTIILVAALPVVELRGAIPVGYWLGLKPIHVFGLAVLGNMLPIPLVIAYIGRVSDWLTERSSLARKFFDWLFKRTRSRADLLVKYRTLGLTLFVAVPLPLTGAWSGAIGAHLLGLPFWESIAANLAGVAIAGVIVTVLCELGWTGAVIAGVGLFAAAIAAFWTSRRKEAVGEDPVV